MLKRSYLPVIEKHLVQHRQMVFMVGPRQVGKTTLCTSLSAEYHYFNWDNQDHRSLIIEGPERIANEVGLHLLSEKAAIVVFDEIHKYSQWKDFLKGLFDVYSPRLKIIVTGSSRLDIYQRGGDSLMGRYFLYHLHPLSIREIAQPFLKDCEIQKPQPLDQDSLSELLLYGGFPEPFLKKNRRFYNRWERLRPLLLFREDLRDVTRVQEIPQIEFLATLLRHQAGKLVNYSNLAKKVRVSVDTIRRWIKILESMYYLFTIQPWSTNIPRSLLKQPKTYLWDWSTISDHGAKVENFVASHLLKAVHWWNDNGFGEYGLYFLRDKEQREVDFVVTRSQKPWFLVEVKSHQAPSIDKNLFYYFNKIGVGHAFQVSFALPYVDADCFTNKQPVIVPVSTFLSQLV